MIDTTNIKTFDDILYRMIAVDTEFCTLKGDSDKRIERETGVAKTFCAAFCNADGDEWAVWTDDGGRWDDILTQAAEKLGIDDPIFVNFSYEAEYEAFRRIHADTSKHPWIDAFLLYRLLKNIQGVPSGSVSLSLVSATKELLHIDRDSEHKDKMRQLCIDDNTAGHEAEILAYCLEDVHDLIPLTEKLWGRLENRLNSAKSGKTITFTPRFRGSENKGAWETFASQIFGLMESEKCFAVISHRGLPVDVEKCDAIKKGVAVVKDRMVQAFVDKYPGTFILEETASKTLDKVVPEDAQAEMLAMPLRDALAAFTALLETKSCAPRTKATAQKQFEQKYELTSIKGLKGKWKRCDAACQTYLRKQLEASGMLSFWKRTPKGALALDQETLAENFKLSDHVYQDGFGGDFACLVSKINTFNGVMKDGDGSWLSTLDRKDEVLRYRSLRPFTSKTGRCQPQTSRGFVPGWDKSLQCVLAPPVGKWLVELDFSAEETLIQARVFSDERYNEIYSAKDTYLWMGAQLGMIPRDEYETLPVKELKAKYGEIRKRLKTFTLALGYGAGVTKLSSKVGLPQEQIEVMCDKVKTDVFPRTTAVREFLQNRIMNGETRCFWLQNGWHTVIHDEKDLSPNAPLNFPIQGTGSVILHRLVVELERLGVITVATVHDAVWILVDEGDTLTIELARKTMERVANTELGLNPWWSKGGIRIGEAEIVRRGEIWTPEHAYDDAAKEVLRAGGYAC